MARILSTHNTAVAASDSGDLLSYRDARRTGDVMEFESVVLGYFLATPQSA